MDEVGIPDIAKGIAVAINMTQDTLLRYGANDEFLAV
jgi:hypothetical protein